MTVKLKDLHSALSKLLRRDAGANVYIDNSNLNVSSSLDGLTGAILLDYDYFTEKEQDAMLALNFMYSQDDKTWYRPLHEFKLPKI